MDKRPKPGFCLLMGNRRHYNRPRDSEKAGGEPRGRGGRAMAIFHQYRQNLVKKKIFVIPVCSKMCPVWSARWNSSAWSCSKKQSWAFDCHLCQGSSSSFPAAPHRAGSRQGTQLMYPAKHRLQAQLGRRGLEQPQIRLARLGLARNGCCLWPWNLSSPHT